MSKTPHLADPDKNPSFTKALFSGEIREDLVFPFPAPSEADREAAWRANVEGPRRLAEHLRRAGGRLLHVSTDYVVPGLMAVIPAPSPLRGQASRGGRPLRCPTLLPRPACLDRIPLL